MATALPIDRRRAAPLVAAVAVTALLAGCGADSGAARAADVCSVGGACAPAVPSGLTLAAELIPPAEADVGRTEYTMVRFDGSGSAHLSLPRRVAVVGRIVDEADKSSVTALVTATRASGLPGLPAVTRSTSTSGNGAFSIELTEGDWLMQVLPQGASQALFPPESMTVQVRTGMAALAISLSRARTLTGVVHTAAGGGMKGVKVRLKDKATGNLLSSEATTIDDPRDGVVGSFTLALASDVAEHAEVRLQADGGGLPVSLQRTFAGKAVVAMAKVELQAPPLRAPQPFIIPLVGKTASGADKPVAGAQVDVAADLTEPKSETSALFATSSVSDQDGNVTLQLVPAGDMSRSYVVTITPASDSPFSRGAFAVAVDAKGGQLAQLRLDARPQLVGQILGPGGSAVGNAIVAAQPAASLGLLGARGFEGALPQVVSDGKDGRFLLRMELGRYDLLVTPPWDSGLALGWLDEVEVSGNAELPHVVLPRVASATVVLVGPDGEPVPGVEVRLYSDVASAPCPVETGCKRPRLRAEGTTSAGGAVRLLVGQP